MANNHDLGQQGETLARQHLQSKNYTILAENWHCKFGELDIIAQDGKTVVFVEVKTRRSTHTEDAFAAITASKRQKLIASAHLYLAEQNISETMWRIDVIGVAIPRHGVPIIEHVEDALDW